MPALSARELATLLNPWDFRQTQPLSSGFSQNRETIKPFAAGSEQAKTK
jgi:hypothetical protein